MITKFVLYQFAASQKLSLATAHDLKKATAKYLNFQSLLN